MNKLMAAVAGLITLRVLFAPIFGSKEEFTECVKFWLTPDIVSLFRGEYWEDSWAEFKLFIWLGCGAAVGYGGYHIF